MEHYEYNNYVEWYTSSWVISFTLAILFGIYFGSVIVATIFVIIGIICIVIGNIIQKKGNNKSEKERNIALKSFYELYKEPILLGNTYLRTRQAQTRQILTGALTYAQPKEYSLHINCTNISDKIVTAVEIEVKTLNAFNEQVSSFIVSTRKQLLFGNVTECSWDLSGSFDINNAITEVKRVMFSDGTIWNNN